MGTTVSAKNVFNISALRCVVRHLLGRLLRALIHLQVFSSTKSKTQKYLILIYVSHTSEVSCSPNAYQLGGVGLEFWVTGKPGRARVGAWDGVWVHGAVHAWWEVF